MASNSRHIENLVKGYIGEPQESLPEVEEEKPKGYWKEIDNAVSEARRVLVEHNFETLPSSDNLCKLGYSSLADAISKYHGGFPEFRRKLGVQNPRKDYGYWNDINNALEEGRKLMEKNGLDAFPSNRELMKLGYSALATAISDFHGGYVKFRKKLGDKLKRIENGLWKNQDYVVKQVKKVMEENGLNELPNFIVLRNLGYTGLVAAVSRYHGGDQKVRELLKKKGIKVEPGRERKGTWSNLEFAVLKAREVMDKYEFDSLPGLDKLREVGYGPLGKAISRYHGGFKEFRKLLGECNETNSKRQLESIVENYVGGNEDDR
jgi:hypothetical protein